MDIVEIVTTLGFPAAVAVFLIWWTTYQLTDKIDTLCEQINNNTRAVTSLALAIMRDKNIEESEIDSILRGE